MKKVLVYTYIVLSLFYVFWLHVLLYDQSNNMSFGSIHVEKIDVPSTVDGMATGASKGLALFEDSRMFLDIYMDESGKVSRMAISNPLKPNIPIIGFDESHPWRDMHYGTVSENLSNSSEAYRDINFDGIFDVSIVIDGNTKRKAMFIRNKSYDWLGCESISDANGIPVAKVGGDMYKFKDGVWSKE